MSKKLAKSYVSGKKRKLGEKTRSICKKLGGRKKPLSKLPLEAEDASLELGFDVALHFELGFKLRPACKVQINLRKVVFEMGEVEQMNAWGLEPFL